MALLVPAARPADWDPGGVVSAWQAGGGDGFRVVCGRVGAVRAAESSGEAAPGWGSGGAESRTVLTVGARSRFAGQIHAHDTRLNRQRQGQEVPAAGRAATAGRRPTVASRDKKWRDFDKLLVFPAVDFSFGRRGLAGGELHLRRERGGGTWGVTGRPQLWLRGENAPGPGSRVQAHAARAKVAGHLPQHYLAISLKRLPARVAKYGVALREAPLRAAHAAHAILTNMVRFDCNECRERFPAFRPAYAPPPEVEAKLEVLKPGRDGLAACSVAVAAWEELPPLDAPDGAARQSRGVCERCRRDIEGQRALVAAGDVAGEVVGLRTAENHMDPCFRFPVDDLKDLFAGATLVESMLVALDHMQVNFVTVSASGLRRLRRNTISYPQDIGTFAARQGFLKHYRPGGRVNSTRGVGTNPEDPDREERHVADPAGAADRERYATDILGRFIIPGRVRERLPDGRVVVEYDHGGVGVERPENITPRLTLPWHPKDVPLHLMLRRNLGGGRGALEGLEVRWWYVANLLQALCAFPGAGHGPWRLCGKEREPMHKYYDRRRFHIMEDAGEIYAAYAPKEVDGVVLSAEEAAALPREERVARAVDVKNVEHFVASGFDVRYVGPDEECGGPGEGGAPGPREGPAVEEPAGAPPAEAFVDEATFGFWMSSAEFPCGVLVQRWWMGLEVGEDDSLRSVKLGDDETPAELYSYIRAEVVAKAAAGKSGGASGARGLLTVTALVEWLRANVGAAFAEVAGGEAAEQLRDDVLHELTIASQFVGEGRDSDRGCVQEPPAGDDEEEDAVKTAERLVYGWPGTSDEPTRVHSPGRYVKAFPLEFPMGVGDLNDPERPRKVSVEVWVQHLLRYHTGQFVGGQRGQRLLLGSREHVAFVGGACAGIWYLSQRRASHIPSVRGGACAHEG